MLFFFFPFLGFMPKNWEQLHPAFKLGSPVIRSFQSPHSPQFISAHALTALETHSNLFLLPRKQSRNFPKPPDASRPWMILNYFKTFLERKCKSIPCTFSWGAISCFVCPRFHQALCLKIILLYKINKLLESEWVLIMKIL